MLGVWRYWPRPNILHRPLCQLGSCYRFVVTLTGNNVLLWVSNFFFNFFFFFALYFFFVAFSVLFIFLFFWIQVSMLFFPLTVSTDSYTADELQSFCGGSRVTVGWTETLFPRCYTSCCDGVCVCLRNSLIFLTNTDTWCLNWKMNSVN